MATINGTNGVDTLTGTGTADTINGRNGNDTIIGGGGKDTLTGGGGSDTFVYQTESDSLLSNWDVITDFTRGTDRINLSALLGATTDLTWGGTVPTANGVWYTRSGTTISVFIDTNGAPATPEMRIDLQNMGTSTVLSASDFTGVVAPANTAPAITSQSSFTVAENTTAAGTVTATDAEGQTLIYGIAGGADAALFSINTATGALSFNAAPNFESPTDAGRDNIYNVTVQASDGSLTTTQAVTVNVTNVNDVAPSFGSATATFSMPENGTAAGTVTATDADGPTLTYGIAGGEDAALFTINQSTGALSFRAAPNFEAPTDVGANNSYNVTVQASDGSFIATQAVTVNVTDVNETAPNTAPTFGASTASYSVPENSTTVGTVTATDAEGQTLTYTIAGGEDASFFTINQSTGALSFVAAPNFEAPADVGANNSYNVTVQASDGLLAATQAVTVNVTDVAEGLIGTAGNDTINGTTGDDLIDISAGGNDTVAAGTGNDTILAGAAFNASDRIDGGTEATDVVETDTLILNGNYGAGVIFNATTLTNMESIVVSAGNNYNLTTSDATVVASTLDIDGSALGAANTLTVNASAETEAGSTYHITGGAGNDVLTAGAGSDYFDISYGGNDTVSAGGGSDTIYAGAALTAADTIDGGTGAGINDFLYLNGNYGGGLTFGASTVTNIEVIVTQAGNNYNLTMNNAMLTGSQGATVDGYSLGSANTLTVNAAAETDTGTVYTLSGGAGNDNLTGGSGNDVLTGNAGNDILVGGPGNDLLTGGAGNDTLTGGTGNDVFDFNVIADRGTTGDVITDFSKSGANGVDVLNLHDLLLTFTGYNGSNAFSGGYLQFDTSSGTGTTVRVDTNGGANSYVTLATVSGTLLLQSDTGNYVL
jgi:Ca2+-binding RTX toxin-like protein